jgi:hypothetical protein
LAEALAFTFGYLIILGRMLTVSGDAAATAANILGQERLFWLGFALLIVAVVFHIAWALLLYELLKPVNRSLSRFAAFIILIGCAIQAVMCVFYLAPLPLLHGGSALAALTPGQLQALAFMFLELNTYAFDVSRVFRTLVHPDGIFDFQVDLPASNFGSAVDDQWFGVGHLPLTTHCESPVPFNRWRLRARRDSAGVLAHRDGCQRPTLERAG